MGLEAATYISGLVATNPVGATDPVSQGDDHIRLLKSVLLATLPGLTGAVSATHTELNQLHGGILTSIGDGTAGAPAYSFASDPNTGIYRNGADVLNIVTGGTSRLQISTTEVHPQLPLQTLDGSASAPTHAFVLDTDTGFYRIGSNTIGIATNGAEVVRFDSGSFILASGKFAYFSDGSASAPGIGFSADTNTGIYRTSADVMNLTTGGTSRLQISTTEVHPQLPLQVLDGSAGAPTYSFVFDTDTGMFRNVSGLNLVHSGTIFLQGTDTNLFLGAGSGAFGITLGGGISIVNTSTSAGANTGASGAPPAQVAGYLVVDIAGTPRKIPYYAN